THTRHWLQATRLTVHRQDTMVEKVAPPSTKVIGNEAKEKFLAWADSEEGVQVSPDVDLFHAFSEGYRGVVATKDIPRGAVLVRIARKCCLGPETTDESKDFWTKAMSTSAVDATKPTQGDSSKPPAPRLTRACLTVLRLLHERGLGESSPFHSYLSVLPQDHRLPLEWTEAELGLLQGTSAEPLVGAGSLDSQFEAFQRVVAQHPTVWEPSVCTKAAFAKGVNWVRSRGFTVMGDPHMIPGADMFNHDPNKQSVQIGTDGEEHFVMKTVQPVKAGEEVFSSFGHISNAQLLNSYGFVLPGNSFDTVLIPTQLVVDTCYATFAKLEADKLGEAGTKNTWEQRLAMVASNRDADEGEQEAFVVSKYDLLPESLADMVQILTMSNDEEVAYATIAAVSQAKMGQYSPLLQDASSGGDLGADARTLARMLVNEEKKVLQDLRLQLMSVILDDDDDEDEGNNNSSSGRGDINSATGTSPDAGEEKGAKKRRKV
ncbi:unnamed protein product, partial [Ectocarpus fasciculatus]